MVKLLILYKAPDDTGTFEEVYFGRHLPLAQQMPGLRKIEINRVTGAPQGEPEYYLAASLYFDDEETMRQSMASDESRAAARALRDLGTPPPVMLLATVEEM